MLVRRLQRDRVFQRTLILNFSRYRYNQLHESIEAAEVARRESYDGVQNICSTGVRALEFCTPETGNYLNLKVINNLASKLKSLESNWIANAVFVGSRSIDFFSLGIHEDDAETEGSELFNRIQSLATHASQYGDKNLLALYGGYITGTPFGMLLGAEYRLGTPSLNLAVLEPTRGQIPLGGLIQQFCLYSPHGFVVSRYLACSGAPIHSVELYEMGILTNLTDHKPHTGWQFGDTILVNDTQAVQPPQGEPSYLPDMVEGVDINCDMDVSKHEAWNHLLLVSPQIPDEDEKPPDHITLIYESVEKVFTKDTLEESVAMLKELAPTELWARNTLKHMSSCDPLALKAVFHLSSEGQKARGEVEKLREDQESQLKISNVIQGKLSVALEKEALIATNLLSKQLAVREQAAKGQSDVGWYSKKVVKKSDFNLALYEDDPVEEVDLLEPKTNKELMEEALLKDEEIRQEQQQFEAAVQNFEILLARTSGEKIW